MANKKIPKFKNEEQERKFWATHDSTDYIDWSKGKLGIFSNLKPSLRTISIRLPEGLIESLKALANKADVPYQSLVKIFLADRVEEEMVQDPDNIRHKKRIHRSSQDSADDS